jgi:antitoxin component YwqK of YwqJK toxin-antitoxin module
MQQSEELFQRNCERWAGFNPKQAVLLPYLETEQYQFSHTQKGELNLKNLKAKPPFEYHAHSGASQEAKEWFSKLNLDKVLVLCVYGVGLGYYYDAAKNWLAEDSSRRLVFLEDDLAVLRLFLETSKAEEMLDNHQVQLLYFQDLKDNEAVLEVLYWNFAMTRLLVTALDQYAKVKREKFAELHHKIAHDWAVKNALVDEYQRYGGAFFINFYQNMLSLPGSYLGNKTFGSFNKVPAIICGAGPSLSKNLPLLAKLKDRALIFAGGSALNALNAAGIQPHLGAGIDPNPAQFERLKSNQAFEVPFYYRNRMYHEAFEMIHGPRLYITGTGGYDVAEWFEEKLRIQHEFLDEGHNVVNFCLQVARQLGCHPILFVGMDLAFTGMKSYAPGVEEDIEFDPNKALDTDDFDERPLLQKDMEGKPLYTLWKWVAESEWIGDFAKEFPETVIINCTEGGLGFPGVSNQTLQEAAEHYLTRTYAIPDRLNGEIQNGRMRVTLPKMVKLINTLRESLVRCMEWLAILIEDAQKRLGALQAEPEKPEPLPSGRSALAETELADEPGYQFVLDIFNQVEARLLSRELHEARSLPSSEQAMKKIELNLKRLSFLQETAKINIGMMDYALEQRKKLKRKKKKLPTQIAGEAFQDIPNFSPILLPEGATEGQSLEDGHLVRIRRQYGKSIEEKRVEKDGVPDGQYLLYYPKGQVKMSGFYKKGKLHGPSIFYSEKGAVLSKSLYVEGLLEGESRWYYHLGAIYAIQRHKHGELHGDQEFFYENGNPKTFVHYEQGKVKGKVLLYYPEGLIKREIEFGDNG